MHIRSFTIVIFCFVLITNFGTFFFEGSCKAGANKIYVDSTYHGYSDGSAEKPYASIQEAIDIAAFGDTIYVFGGYYKETLIIDKKLKLVGSIEGGDTVIEGGVDRRYTVEINADEVILEGVAIMDSGDYITSPIGSLLCIKSRNVVVQGNNFTDTNTWGIYLDSSSDGNVISGNNIYDTKRGIYVFSSGTNDILSNVITDCSESGIQLYSSPNNRLYNNNVSSCSHGFYIENCDNINISHNTVAQTMFNGVFLSQCNNAIVKNNYFLENNGDGVYLDSYNCMVFDNYFKDNRRGLTITRSGCEIFDNDIYSSTASGVYAMYGSTDNLIYLNHFLRNGKSAEEKGNNQWYHGTKGNYWSDYNEVDRDLDGIGDTFYTREGVLDKYPLGYFLKPPDKPSDPDPGDGASSVGLIITLEVYVSDPDSEMLDVYFYKAVDDSLIGIDKRVLNNSVASYTFKQAFNTTFVWYAIAKDGDLENRSDTWFFITRTTPPDNKPPVADAGGPYEGWLNQAITFDASKSYDPDGDIDFHRWNFGDGTSEILAVSPQHIYRNPGSYEVTLTVIDDDGSSDMVKTIATIFGSSTDQKPIADAGGPYFCNVGQLVILDGSESSDPDGIITNYSWIFDDGASNYGNPSTYSFSKPGMYTVQLIVTDNSGYKATNTSSITVEYKESYKGTPGFELLLFVTAVVVIFSWKRKRIK